MLGENKEVFSEKIVKLILDDIAEGRLKPGDKLPSEKQMTAIYQVGRFTIREALRTLGMMSVIDIMQGKGAFVTSLDPELLVQNFDFVFSLNKSTIVNLFEARTLFEPQVAYIAAQRATPEMITEMQELVKNDCYIDIILHEKIARATKNPVIIQIIISLGHIGKISRKQTSIVPGVQEEAHRQHIALVNAIAEHDCIEAQKCMAEHLDYVINSYRKYIEKSDDAAVERMNQEGGLNI